MCTPFWGSIQSLISLVLSCPLLMTAWEKKTLFICKVFYASAFGNLAPVSIAIT